MSVGALYCLLGLGIIVSYVGKQFCFKSHEMADGPIAQGGHHKGIGRAIQLPYRALIIPSRDSNIFLINICRFYSGY